MTIICVHLGKFIVSL